MSLLKNKQDNGGGIGRKMLVSSLFMPISTLLSLIYTRVLLQFLGETDYGTWITISSFAQWVLYFDVGIGNGMRNELAKEIDSGNYESAKRVTSTSYYIISIIAIGAFTLFAAATFIIDTDSFFGNSAKTKPIILITSLFTCVNFVLSLCKSQLYAQQRAEHVGLMNVLVHVLQLFGIYIASLIFEGNIIAVAIITGLSSVIIYALFSSLLWRKNAYCRPERSYVDMQYSKRISTLGIRFFILQIGCLVIYSTDNLIITSLFGSDKVTSYNMVYKVFNLVLVAFSAFISPVWSNITVETNRKNFEYIQKIAQKLSLLVLPICVGLFILTLIFQDLSNWWLGKELHYEKSLIFSMAIFIALNIYSSIYSAILNGMGELNVQLFVSVFVALLNIPLSIYLSTSCEMGITGVIVASNICMVISTLTVVLQSNFVLKKLLKARNRELMGETNEGTNHSKG